MSKELCYLAAAITIATWFNWLKPSVTPRNGKNDGLTMLLVGMVGMAFLVPVTILVGELYYICMDR